MREKFEQFVSNLNGQYVEVSYRPAAYQCMDLAYVWAFALGVPKATIQHDSAYKVWDNANDLTREYFDLIPNTPDAIPQDGDIVVWNNKYGPYGHIGIALGGGTTNRFKVFEQNNPLGTNAHVQERGYTNVSGWLRFKKQVTSTPQWLINFLTENNLNLNSESEIRAIFDKAKKYDDEITNLKEQVKSANETLSDKALEVSLLTDQKTSLENKIQELTERLNKATSERDTAVWEKEKADITIKELQEDVKTLQEKLEQHEKKNDLYAYGWWDRFVSLFRR